jgi:acyl-CoA synthetase (AMP-forming)/AMP-acid ligase II/3-hydroxymyristoyl/3-hydroxydecanoyl-(acyl carrier protein) dehydratase
MNHSLLGRHEPSDLVAFGKGGERTAADLLADAARIVEQLPAPSEGSHVLLVFKSDRYGFASSLLGAWAAGHAVALPPNTSRDSVLGALRRPDVVAMLHDTDAGRPVRIEPFSPAATQGPGLAQPTLPERDVVATLFTSGTESAMTPCPKSAVQLLSEAHVLAEAFRAFPGERFVATVQPSHIYGLLYSVLIPLVSGGAFIRETPFHAETIAARVKEHAARVLVTVPAHLRGLSDVEGGGLSSLTRVFSSTAPLRAEISGAFLSAHQTPVTEILGSTETGGIAWREQPEREAWEPLPEVEVSVDEDAFLWVRSPFAGGEVPMRTADLGKTRADGSFLHLGRSDGIVKVGGQRVSLPAMEHWLFGQESVEDAAVLAVQAGGLREVQLLAALVAPGWTVPRLREAIAARFETSAVPRRILLVKRLPREDNGKLPRRRLLRLFGLNAEGEAIRWDLDWGERSESVEGDRVTLRVPVHIPETYGAFEGHFPGYPILAAAFQLDDLVLPRIRAERPELGAVRSVRRLKFLGRIVPDDRLELVLRWNGAEPAIDFSVARGDKVCSGGRILFDGTDA